MQIELKDNVEHGDVPALAFIGYIESFLEGDRAAQTAFESSFGRTYMGVGAMTLAAASIASVSDYPTVIIDEVLHEYRRAFLPSARAVRTFLEGVRYVVYALQYNIEHDCEDDEECRCADGVQIEYVAPPTRRSNAASLRSLAEGVVCILLALEAYEGVPANVVLQAARRNYMSS